MEVQAKDVLSQSEEMDIMGRMDAHIWSLHDSVRGKCTTAWWAQKAVSEHGSFWSEFDKEAAARSRSPRGRAAASTRPDMNLGDLSLIAQLPDFTTDELKEIFVVTRLELSGRGVDVD